MRPALGYCWQSLAYPCPTIAADIVFPNTASEVLMRGVSSDRSPNEEPVGLNGSAPSVEGYFLRALYSLHFSDRRREKLFWASVSFFVTFAIIRGIAHAVRTGSGLFKDVSVGSTHVHHLVWGILLLLVVGYLWLVHDDYKVTWKWLPLLNACLYGIGSALTLDEFALWLNLEDVYWAKQGRESVDAVVLFGALLCIGVWGGPFFHGVVRQMMRVWRH